MNRADGLVVWAEAALLTAIADDRVDAVVALAPIDVAWEGQHEHDPRRSKWTGGTPVAFVPLDRALGTTLNHARVHRALRAKP
jgi:hypothetical protein